jgi:hypothetical protein
MAVRVGRAGQRRFRDLRSRLANDSNVFLGTRKLFANKTREKTEDNEPHDTGGTAMQRGPGAREHGQEHERDEQPCFHHSQHSAGIGLREAVWSAGDRGGCVNWAGSRQRRIASTRASKFEGFGRNSTARCSAPPPRGGRSVVMTEIGRLGRWISSWNCQVPATDLARAKIVIIRTPGYGA